MQFECKSVNLLLSKSLSACICKMFPSSVTHLAAPCAAETSDDLPRPSWLKANRWQSFFPPYSSPALSLLRDLPYQQLPQSWAVEALPATGHLGVWQGFLGSGFVLPERGLVLLFAFGTGVELGTLIKYEGQEWECDNCIY